MNSLWKSLVMVCASVCCSCVSHSVHSDEAAIHHWQRQSAKQMRLEAWHAPKWHQALTGETIEHVRQLASACKVSVRFAADVPEAAIPTGFEGWGMQFDQAVSDKEAACVLAKAKLTAATFTSAAEAAEAKAN